MEHIHSKSELESFIRSNECVIIDFHATWCLPCKKMSVLLEKIIAKNPFLKIAKVDVDENEDISEMFEITNLPTLFFVRSGKEIHKVVGLEEKEVIEALYKFEK